VETRHQLGFARHAGPVTASAKRFDTQETWESAMNEAMFGLTSPANAAGNFALSTNK
jgi:hypothetical protein